MTMSPYTEKELLTNVRGHSIDTTILAPDDSEQGNILLIHGAGESTKDRLLPLARALASRGWRCLVFSLPGHGQSSGTLLGSTLAERAEVSRAVAEAHGFWPSDIAIGVSMGAHTVLSLLAEDASLFKKIVLLVPAIYAGEAETVPFGPDFSTILRSPQSYKSAKVWDILPSYTGELTTIQAGQDTVIPVDIYELIHLHATSATVQHVRVDDSAHQISFWLAADENRIAAFADGISSFSFSPLARYGSHALASE